ncbi:MAG: GntR family transcriptional regulator [Bacteroidales bacterium]|nr:GntR family transcriptional regulator [Bacteroidales bacterium]MDD7724354.1 GntR family transcriptional regulator [Bacteroidales bacterium]MDY4175349.1 GntR family transcriptional regulator [Bacteroidales bacterium]
MADRICDEIISGTYAEGDRVPSVRDYAVSLQVNTNTAVKAYESLGRDGIIYNKRGLGYFVADGAKQKIMDERRNNFFETALPEFFRQMRMLNITIDEVSDRYKAQQAESD